MQAEHRADLKKVLIIDDNVDACHALVLLVAILGHRAECVGDPRLAVSAAERIKPDLILLDVTMPHIDGWTLAPMLRRARPQARICVVSAYDSPRDREQSMRAGCDAHLSKPLASELLQDLLRA